MKHPVDAHVGRKIRHQRWMVGMTQQQLAEPSILRTVLLLQGLPTSLGELALGLGGMLLAGCGYAIIVGGDQP